MLNSQTLSRRLMQTKISIVTIVYNGQGCIEKTIKSVLEQTYRNIEYIIIDGLSTDTTLELIAPYNDKIDKLISGQDSGIYDAMNKGLKEVTGDYVIFMNCDDTFTDKDTLGIIANSIKKNNSPDFIYGDAIEESSIDGTRYAKNARDPKYLWYGMFAHHQSMAYKMSVITKHNLKYDLQYKIGADYGFTAEFLTYGKEIHYIDKPLCIFMQDGASAVDYKVGLKEQWQIRKNIFKYNIFTRFGIFLIHYNMIMIRRYLPAIYNNLRFKKQK